MITRISLVANIMLFRALPGGRLLDRGNISNASPTPSAVSPLVLTLVLVDTLSSAYANVKVSTL